MTVDATSGSNPYASLIANSDLVTQTNAAKNANKTDTSTAATAAAKTKEDKDMFLKLLVAQLKYQDPSKPADTTQFMAQTAQFSALETMQEVAASRGSMVAAQNKLQASALVGQTVSYTGEDGTVKTGSVKSVSFTQGSAGGTAGEPVLNVDGVSVVLSKVTGVGTIDAAAINEAAAKAAAEKAGTSSSTASSNTASSGSSSTSGATGTSGATETSPATGTTPATGSDQNSGTTGTTGSSNSDSSGSSQSA
jgi:flagellar basal-body rod modification protein FlgD